MRKIKVPNDADRCGFPQGDVVKVLWSAILINLQGLFVLIIGLEANTGPGAFLEIGDTVAVLRGWRPLILLRTTISFILKIPDTKPRVPPVYPESWLAAKTFLQRSPTVDPRLPR